MFHHNDDTALACKEHNITLEAFAPFTDFRLPVPSEKHTVFHDPTVLKVAAKHNVSAAQVALRWILQHGHILTFLCSNSAHDVNDADVFGFALDAADMTVLDRIQTNASDAELDAEGRVRKPANGAGPRGGEGAAAG